MTCEHKNWLPGFSMMCLLTGSAKVTCREVQEQFFFNVSSSGWNLLVEYHEEAVYKDIIGRWLLPVGDKSVYRTCIAFNMLLYLHAAGKSLASKMKSQNVWAFLDQCVPEGGDHMAIRTSESNFDQATSKVSEVSSLFNLMKSSFLSIFPEDCRE